MKVAIGCDHHGVVVRERLIEQLREQGHDVEDAGTSTDEPVDYPDIAANVSRLVGQGRVDRGILICGTGIGMAIAANKHHGVRAAACNDREAAEMSRRHNDTNVLCLSGDRVDLNTNEQIVNVWITTLFDGGRHQRRIDKINRLDDSAN
jgi:ribose 5-phosphate isomerase B